MVRTIPVLFCMLFAAVPLPLNALDRETVAIIGAGDMGDSIGHGGIVDNDLRIGYTYAFIVIAVSP